MPQYLVGCNIGARQISRSIINGQRQMGHMSLNLFLFGILAWKIQIRHMCLDLFIFAILYLFWEILFAQCAISTCNCFCVLFCFSPTNIVVVIVLVDIIVLVIFLLSFSFLLLSFLLFVLVRLLLFLNSYCKRRVTRTYKHSHQSHSRQQVQCATCFIWL